MVIIEQLGLKFVSMTIDGLSVTPAVTVGGGRDTVRYTVIKPLRTFSSFQGDTIYVTETYRVDACSPGGSSSSITGYWGCGTSPVCQAAATNASVQVPLSVPLFDITTQRVGLGCYNTKDTIILKIANTGGIATDLNLQVGTVYPNAAYFYNQYIPNSLSFLNALDTANFYIGNSPTGPWTRVHGGATTGQPAFTGADTMSINNGLTWPFGTLNRRNVVIPLVGSGSILYFRYLTFNRCPNQTNVCTDYYHYSMYSANWKNNCGTTSYTEHPEAVGGNYGAGSNSRKALGEGTTDVNDGDTATLHWEFSEYSSGNYQHDTSVFYLEVKYPQGWTYVNDTANRKLSNPANSFKIYADS